MEENFECLNSKEQVGLATGLGGYIGEEISSDFDWNTHQIGCLSP
jgi:hypothetical protein